MESNLERVTVTASNNGSEKRLVNVLGADDRNQGPIEHLEPYGFTSEPYVDSETDAVAAHFGSSGSNTAVILVNDSRFRITKLKTGEVCIYDDKGHKVYLHNERIEVDGVSDPIDVHTSGTITVLSESTVNIQAPTINLNSSGSINLTASGTINLKAPTIKAN